MTPRKKGSQLPPKRKRRTWKRPSKSSKPLGRATRKASSAGRASSKTSRPRFWASKTLIRSPRELSQSHQGQTGLLGATKLPTPMEEFQELPGKLPKMLV